jgi:hypothetical protein
MFPARTPETTREGACAPQKSLMIGANCCDGGELAGVFGRAEEGLQGCSQLAAKPPGMRKFSGFPPKAANDFRVAEEELKNCELRLECSAQNF